MSTLPPTVHASVPLDHNAPGTLAAVAGVRMTTPIYQVDAFSRTPFAGNPAAVCPLSTWPSEQWMQNVAMENNLSETAFFVRSGKDYEIRWFSPICEIELCGHATLASAFVLWQYLGEQAHELSFRCTLGSLTVTRQGEQLELNLPSRPIYDSLSDDSAISAALGCKPSWAGQESGRCLVELSTQQQLAQLQPDMNVLMALPYEVFFVTAAGDTDDFVCRVFAPAKGIDEDPVTGSAFTALTPYWAAKLNKTHLVARQLSRRGGLVTSRLVNERVLVAGHAVCVMRGELLMPFDCLQ